VGDFDGLSEWCSEWLSGAVGLAMAMSSVLGRQPSASQAANEQRENYIWDAGVSPPLACSANAQVFSALPLPTIECKLNRAAHEVNFTCISLAISACSTQRVMLHGEKMLASGYQLPFQNDLSNIKRIRFSI